MYFLLTSSNYLNTGGNSDLLIRQNSFMKKTMSVILEEVINYVGQTHVGWTNIFIFATFFQH